ncbi:MAG TPA: STAS domain-containing protein [Stellaceae bacterium]|nr:STAS domain-containing protein [Stellaceae bacterium]
MNLEADDRESGVTWITLDGRLDIAGAGAIDLKFSALTGSRRLVVVDLSRVTFLASMGMRLLLSGAKTVASKGGRLVLHAPIPTVEQVLTTAGIDTVIPVLRDHDSAVAAVLG